MGGVGRRWDRRGCWSGRNVGGCGVRIYRTVWWIIWKWWKRWKRISIDRPMHEKLFVLIVVSHVGLVDIPVGRQVTTTFSVFRYVLQTAFCIL